MKFWIPHMELLPRELNPIPGVYMSTQRGFLLLGGRLLCSLPQCKGLFFPKCRNALSPELGDLLSTKSSSSSSGKPPGVPRNPTPGHLSPRCPVPEGGSWQGHLMGRGRCNQPSQMCLTHFKVCWQPQMIKASLVMQWHCQGVYF